MTRNFSVTGAAALLAVAVCSENNGENVSFAFESLIRSYAPNPHHPSRTSEGSGSTLWVEVERISRDPETPCYHCTIHHDTTLPIAVQ